MKAKQITTYHVKGEAKTWEKALAPEDESKSVKMIESNVINLYPDFAFQTIEGFGGAMTEEQRIPGCPVWMRKHRIRHYRIFSDRTAFMQDLSACRSTAVTIPLRVSGSRRPDRRPGSGNLLDRPRPQICPSDAEKSHRNLRRADQCSDEPVVSAVSVENCTEDRKE